jgi:hypothetical protein
MPILYPICLIFLIVKYIYSKFMLLKYCQRSQTFNEDLILSSYRTVKFAIMLHMVLTVAMFGNSKML